MIRTPYRYHRLLLSIVMVAFLGQSLTAAASSCAMMDFDAGDVGSQGMDHRDHSSHGSDQDETPSQAPPVNVCCNGSGYCSMLDCVSVVALLPAKPSTVFPQDSIIGEALKPAIPHFIASPLFKPPINA